MIGECHKFDRAGHPSRRGRVSRAHPRSGFISSTGGGQCREGGAAAVGGGFQRPDKVLSSSVGMRNGEQMILIAATC